MKSILNPAVTVGIASLCEERQIERCLRALEAQSRDVPTPEFDVIVAHNRPADEIVRLRERFPTVRFVNRPGWWAPIQLMALAAAGSRGDVFIMTEDHCVPHPEWVFRLHAALRDGRSAAGGPIDTHPHATRAAWAFYFLDFFRYASPVAEGVSPALSVCNVAYRRTDLASIRDCWESGFHETVVHERLRPKHGPLWMEPGAGVTMRRDVTFAGAMAECYGQGRLFASKRVELGDAQQRLIYLLLAPILPALLLARRTAKGLSHPALRRKFLPASPWLVSMVFAWSWGEAMGYLTGRPPRQLALARDSSS